MLSKKVRYELDSLIEDLRHFKDDVYLKYIPAWEYFLNLDNETIFKNIHAEMHDDFYYCEDYRKEFSKKLKDVYVKYYTITRALKADVIDYLEFRGMSVEIEESDDVNIYKVYIRKKS